MRIFGGAESYVFSVSRFSLFDAFDVRSNERRASSAQRPGRAKFTDQAFHAVSATAAYRLEQNAARENQSVPRRQRSIR